MAEQRIPRHLSVSSNQPVIIRSAGDHQGLDGVHQALAVRDERAWETLYSAYAPQVRRWAARMAPDLDAEPLVTATFTHLWQLADAERWESLPDRPSILEYLKACLGVAVREQRRTQPLDDAHVHLEGIADRLAARDNPETHVSRSVRKQEFWATVRAQLQSMQEVRLVQLAFIEGLQPWEICREAPNLFPNEAAVHRVQHAVVERLRHCPEMHRFAGRFTRVATRAKAG